MKDLPPKEVLSKTKQYLSVIGAHIDKVLGRSSQPPAAEARHRTQLWEHVSACIRNPDLSGRGLHSSTSQLNLSHVSHKATPYISPDTPLTRATQPLRAPPIPYKALKLSRKVDECKPLLSGEKIASIYARLKEKAAAKVAAEAAEGAAEGA
jgi:hypothetical protein